MKKFFDLLRIKHYIKNFLIFVPLFFSTEIANQNKLHNGILGFFSFCFISSAVYIINDLKDLEKDKLHPLKKKRPIASGQVKKQSAILICFFLILISCIITILLKSYLALFLELLYLLINLAYSLGMKNIPILDILILTSGFLIRILYGAEISDVIVSDWLYLTVFSSSLYLGLGKRRNEFEKNSDGKTRKVLEKYNYNFLDKYMYVCVALTNIFYALWAVSRKNHLVWTVPIVMIIFMKYSLDIEGDSDGDPVEVVFRDKILMLLILLYILIISIVIYAF